MKEPHRCFFCYSNTITDCSKNGQEAQNQNRISTVKFIRLHLDLQTKSQLWYTIEDACVIFFCLINETVRSIVQWSPKQFATRSDDADPWVPLTSSCADGFVRRRAPLGHSSSTSAYHLIVTTDALSFIALRLSSTGSALFLSFSEKWLWLYRYQTIHSLSVRRTWRGPISDPPEDLHGNEHDILADLSFHEFFHWPRQRFGQYHLLGYHLDSLQVFHFFLKTSFLYSSAITSPMEPLRAAKMDPSFWPARRWRRLFRNK